MDTNKMTQEQISALVDDELADEYVDQALVALRKTDGRVAWDVYHQIGDVLRSDDMAHEFSPGFTARLMDKLDAEPTVVAPQAKPIPVQQPMVAAGGIRAHSAAASFRRIAVPTAIAAAAAFALISSPQLLVAMKGGASDKMAPVMVASKEKPATLEQVAARDVTVTTATQNGVVLRDPRIDEYLLAHQRFSPAWNSTAQYARSATFASDSDK